MTTEEYKKELNDLKDLHEKKIRELNIKYAQSNNPYKVGDIVTDHISSIKIQKFGTHVNYGYNPQFTCIGIELKKDGTPTKKGEIRTVYQSNIKISSIS